MMVCNDCGNAADSADGFCSACGALLEWSGKLVGSPRRLIARQPVAEAGRPPPVQVSEQTVYTGPYCPACGARNPEGRTFCRSCGWELRNVTIVQSAVPGWRPRLLDRLRARPAHPAGVRPHGFASRDVGSAAVTANVPGTATPGTGGPAPAGARSFAPAGAPGRGGGTHAGWPGGGNHGTSHRHQVRPPRRVALSRFGPLLILLGLLGVGIGIGPARQWITAHILGLEQKISGILHERYVLVSPVEATASSSAPGHSGQLAVDGTVQTYWLTSGNNGFGATLIIKFGSPQNIDAVGLFSGEPGGAYLTQARPKALTIIARGNSPAYLSFDNTSNFQNRPVQLRNVTSITVKIRSVYPGQAGQAVAIREIEFFNRV